MDDQQNQTNQPFDPGTVSPPVVPDAPLDITPPTMPELSTPPAGTVPPSPWVTPAPASEPMAPPAEITPVAPWTAPVPADTPAEPVPPAIPLNPPSPEPFSASAFSMTPPSTTGEPIQEPASAEPVMPAGKPKSKILPIIGGVAALLLVIGVAGAAYYVSNQLSTRQAVAPTAPESEPLAGNCTSRCSADGTCEEDECGAGACHLPGDPVGVKNGKKCIQNSDTCPACGGGGGGDTCATLKDTPKSTVTFAKAGTVSLFTRGPVETITLSGPKTVSFTTTVGEAVQHPTKFSVTAGETYTVTVRLSNETADSMGFIATKSAHTCGPTSALCGGNVDITPVETLAKANSKELADIECWGDMLKSDITQDYDYNDFTLIFGYDKDQIAGACMLISIYKKVNGVYGTTPLTAAQLQTLEVGDVLKFTLTSNVDRLFGRFRVSIDGTPGAWLWGNFNDSNRKLNVYNDYTVTTEGVYKFEGQVSTTSAP